MRAVLFEKLKSYCKKNKISFHTPGHKSGRAFKKSILNPEYDLTELKETDNLFKPASVIARAQKNAASVIGSKQAFFLVNGASSGICALLCAICREGERVLVERNCHVSVLHALALCGAEPVYIYNKFSNGMPLPPGKHIIKAAMESNRDIKTVVITSPNYYGYCADIKGISEVVHSHNGILVCDEAHGAHFYFSDLLPEGSLKSGADACVLGFHKTMPALTQSALLCVNKSVNGDRVKKMLGLFTTTSPSYLLMGMLDRAVVYMYKHGDKLYKQTANQCLRLRQMFCSDDGLVIIENSDVTRIVADLTNIDITSEYAEKILISRFNVVPEMKDDRRLVFIVTPFNTEKDLKALEKGLKYINNNFGYCKKPPALIPPIIKSIISPRKACFGLSEEISIKNAVDRVVAENIIVFPPSVPVVCAGELLTEDMTEYLRSVCSVDKIKVVK